MALTVAVEGVVVVDRGGGGGGGVGWKGDRYSVWQGYEQV